DKYPSHLNIKVNAGQYAWKPALILDACQQFGGKLIWSDSKNLFDDVSAIFSTDYLTCRYILQYRRGASRNGRTRARSNTWEFRLSF
ncbi:MAG: hypothetical protein ACYCOU_06570, partial [Sulfobacillus sp.]